MPARNHNAERYPNGRLKVSQAYDRGNERIRRMRELFDAKCFQGGGRGKESGDSIGQLWLCGKFEGFPVESVRLLMVGREYARLWSERYSDMAARTGKYEQTDRSTNQVARRTRDDIRFGRMEEALAGNDERKAVYDLVCKYYGTDTIVDWAARIVADGLLSRGFVFDIMELAGEEDYQKLAAATRGLFALHDGEMPGRLERRAA